MVHRYKGMNILGEILIWSGTRPAWQQDALRRLVVDGSIPDAGLEELALICKGDVGLATRTSHLPLEAQHMAIRSRANGAITLKTLVHHAGVNALSPEQTVSFGPALTLVYGHNAAGKSGYTRILKGLCRARGAEAILANVLQEATPPSPKASVCIVSGGLESTFQWNPKKENDSRLGEISIFDSHCASVYLRDKTDVAFRPYGLDLMDRLARVCEDLRMRLEKELEQLEKQIFIPPSVFPGTAAHAFLSGLSALSDPNKLRKLATLSDLESARLKAVQSEIRDLKSTDPASTAKRLSLLSGRLDSLVKHLEIVEDFFGEAGLEELKKCIRDEKEAAKALDDVQKAAMSPDMIAGTGTQHWRELWEAARSFSKEAFPERAFPHLAKDAKCLLCQQELEKEAVDRFKKFKEFVESASSGAFEKAKSKSRATRKKVADFSILSNEVTSLIEELSVDDEVLGKAIQKVLGEAEVVQSKATSDTETFAGGVSTSQLREELKGKVAALRARADQLKKEDRAGVLKSLTTEVTELEARKLLFTHLDSIVAEIERKKKVAVYGQCIFSTATDTLTRKSTELTKRAVTDQLKQAFQDELKKLDFTQIEVEIKTAGGTRGVLYHKIVFQRAPSINLPTVLSEGEQRALSLAAFLAELSTSSNKSAIVFDDPVSSLDHVWRERVAKRLVAEAGGRQIIVFTHDIVFLLTLKSEAERLGIECHTQNVRRDALGPGRCSSDLPWVAMKVKDRIGRLKALWQVADKTFRTSSMEEYEKQAREIYGLLREAWERGIEEVLLHDMVERYRPSIETQRLRYLHDITKEDCDKVEEGMTECSRWFRGHDEAAAIGSIFPKPEQVRLAISALETWADTIRKRRN
jgi:energy-coupling factor transporter ATP-binding protein EcfA2